MSQIEQDVGKEQSPINGPLPINLGLCLSNTLCRVGPKCHLRASELCATLGLTVETRCANKTVETLHQSTIYLKFAWNLYENRGFFLNKDTLDGKTLDSHTLAHKIVDIVEDRQASDIVLLDIREQSSVSDYFVIATVHNERQARAIEEELLLKLRLEQSVRPLNIEGVDAGGSGWVLLDYGDVVIHLFTEEMRSFYSLEDLWSKANVVVKVF